MTDQEKLAALSADFFALLEMIKGSSDIAVLHHQMRGHCWNIDLNEMLDLVSQGNSLQ